MEKQGEKPREKEVLENRYRIPACKALMLAFVFSMFCCLSVLIIHGKPSSNRDVQTQMRPIRNKEARKLFKQHCAKCHGADGAGETVQGKIAGAPDFTDPQWHEQFEDQGLIYSVTHGRSQMPAFGKKLTQQQIKTLVSYVRAFSK